MLSLSSTAARSPFIDRSNASRSDSTVSNKLRAPLPVRHTRSRQIMIGSSDLVQDVNDAIYNASLVGTTDSSASSHFPPEKENLTSSDTTDVRSHARDVARNGLVVGSGPRFVNKPQGTQLGTILEQHSSYTLRSRCSNKTLTVTSYRLPNAPDKVLVEFQPGISHIGRPVSDDEGVLSRLRRVRTIVDREVGRLRKSTSSTDSSLPAVLGPARPPFRAPERASTPVGVSPFSGSNGVSAAFSTTRARNGPRQLLAYLTRRTKQAKLNTYTNADAAPRSSTLTARPWRPPVSGQSTFRYGDPGAHPFYNAPAASVETISTRSHHENIAPPIISPSRQTSLHRRSVSSTSTSSAAQRALGAITGHAIPVNPARALSTGIARSVPLPKHVGPARLVTISENHSGMSHSRSQAIDSIRTIDLIQRFPPPPSRPTSITSIGQADGIQVVAPVPVRPVRPPLSVLKFQETGGVVDSPREVYQTGSRESVTTTHGLETATRFVSSDSRTDSVLQQPSKIDGKATNGGPNPEEPLPTHVCPQTQDGSVSTVSTPSNSRYHSGEPSISHQDNQPPVASKEISMTADVRSYEGLPLMTGALGDIPSPVADTGLVINEVVSPFSVPQSATGSGPSRPAHDSDALNHIIYNTPTTYGQMCPHVLKKNTQTEKTPIASNSQAYNISPQNIQSFKGSLLAKLRLKCRVAISKTLSPSRQEKRKMSSRKANKCWRCKFSDAAHAIAVKIDLCCEEVNMKGVDLEGLEAAEIRVARPVSFKEKAAVVEVSGNRAS